MKGILCLPLLLTACAWGDEAADRTAIEKAVTQLDFSADADVAAEFHRLWPAGEPWSEVTPPRIQSRAIRFITPDVALVDATSTQYGSVILVRRVPLVLVMRRERTEWRIAALRVAADRLMPAPITPPAR